ncbi:MAG: hypothetical protein A2Z16_02930 [Chloroflexi bacterium RBG_16_54_18]|nr:MAG: hypothetical protein A2Z16_02930 [Chloroflexi bacterium RBG_16_54_18]
MKAQHPPVCDYEGSGYQENFWDRGGREYEDQVEAIALHRLLPPSGSLLLELGAGAGRNTPRYPGFPRIVLLDYSLSQLRLAQERLGISERYVYVAADVYRLPFTAGLFDAATMIRTLHHLQEPALALEQLRQVLQPGAIFILEYANKRNLKAILRYWLGRQSWNPFSLAPVEFAELNFDFHPRAVRLWLAAAGFRLERQLTVSHFRIAWMKRLLPLGLLVKLDALFQWSGAWWQLTPSVFLRSTALGEPREAPSGDFFRCPECKFHLLAESGDRLDCPSCQRSWAIRDGIYDFRQPADNSG